MAAETVDGDAVTYEVVGHAVIAPDAFVVEEVLKQKVTLVSKPLDFTAPFRVADVAATDVGIEVIPSGLPATKLTTVP